MKIGYNSRIPGGKPKKYAAELKQKEGQRVKEFLKMLRALPMRDNETNLP